MCTESHRLAETNVLKMHCMRVNSLEMNMLGKIVCASIRRNMHGNAYNFSADVSKKLQNINKLQSEAETE